jgi:hypothetical protein
MEKRNNQIVAVTLQPIEPVPTAELYLDKIRPEWQAKTLVARVRKLISVDPSSACQRLFNAAIHDLREKIRVLGLDLAADVAKTYRLPPITSDEGLEDYPTARLIDLAYQMGILNRPEWRRMHRAYDIRRDLEHEDDEYEASVGDLLYIFETAIDVVLQREPIQVIQLQDILDVVESDSPIHIAQDLVDDYKEAPPQRKDEIIERLTFWALDQQRPELVRHNCLRLLRKFALLAPASSKISLAKKLETRIGRKTTDFDTARVAVASGAFPFIHRRQQRALIDAFVRRFSEVKPNWKQHPLHAELLDDILAAGGLEICPRGSESRVLRWMIEAYVGEPGGYGAIGRNRKVFYSDTAAPRIEELLEKAPQHITEQIHTVAQSSTIRGLIQISEQNERLLSLISLVDSSACLS